MATISCNDCGKQISSRADKCLHCGRLTYLGQIDFLFGSDGLILLFVLYFGFG